MPEGRDQKIGPTAHYTAYVWRRLGLKHADLFATGTGAALFWSFRLAGEWVAAVAPGVPSMPQYLAQRHLAIDHALAQAAPDRVVELGAGLSRRGVTWALDHGVRYVEIDLPHMVEAKRARIPGDLRARLGGRLSHASHDVLADDFADALAAHLEGAERPAIVAEGLLGYFTREEQLKIARSIRQALAGRPRGEADAHATGVFLCDLRAAEGGRAIRVGANVLKAAIRLVTRGRGAREDFRDEADVRAFFAEAGFTEAEPVDLAEVPGAPRVPSPARVWRARVV
ncbi:MAG: class I SAM-dependent methyltransferase [Deltaproteobacteria bacterium]|nr:class I SAM-dependent methyltransferase [Deltaproteobacteria bacterium]